MPLPGDNPDLRHRLITHERLADFSPNQPWPPRELEWLIAIAQHYGVPTRFVDWTRKPHVAAWFAVEQPLAEWGKGEERNEWPPCNRFVVWALNRERVQAIGWKMASAPRAAVPNLHLQSGMFTYRPVEYKDFAGNRDATELCRAVNAMGGNTCETLRAASVPWSEAGRMLKLLRDRFVQGCTVYAGYEGVSRSVKELRWRRSSA